MRFTFEGKRYTLAVGLPDSKINRLVAHQKATQIELNITSDNFDTTLKKYKPPKTSKKKAEQANVWGLFQNALCECEIGPNRTLLKGQNINAKALLQQESESVTRHLSHDM
ncbi:MAG: DUF3596 domain-containing protein [Cyanobacteria bacterium P01_D01_bin.71]